MKYLTNIDMKQNEIQNPLIHPTASAPADPKVGQMYTDTSGSEAKLMWFNGIKWVQLGASAPEKNPSKTEPSVKLSLSGVDVSNLEVGTTAPISFDATFNPGSYTYGPETGVTVKSWKVYDTDGNVSTEPTGTFSDVTVGDNTSYKITVEAEHTAGAIPLTDQGSQYPAAQILAGKKTASTGSIAGFRKYFYGASASILDLTSDSIRSLTHSTAPIGDGVAFDLPIPKGSSQVIIAFPSSAGLTLSSVIDTGAFNIDVYDIFTKYTIDVEGANGYGAISYDVYVYTPDVALNKNTYKIIISK